MNIATFEREIELSTVGYDAVIGVDEAGRGPLAGPVVAGACVLKEEVRDELLNTGNPSALAGIPAFAGQASPLQMEEGAKEGQILNRVQDDKEGVDDVIASDKLWDFVRDSKTVSEKKREAVYDFILEHYHVGVGIASAETIDRMNILEATFLAMKMALSQLRGESGEGRSIILIDGNLKIPNLTAEQKTVTKGDSKVKCIAAASIVAKVVRDRKMLEYDAVFPQYGFAKHKGYGTKVHMEALKEHGATPIHRKSFAPVKRVL